MKTLLKFTPLVLFIILVSCQKETSFEKGNSTASVGSLATDASGNCLGAVISGNYYKDTALTASNYVDVTVQVDTAGSYSISSDTVNGYYFKASGTFTATGTQTVRLVGGGKPLATGSNIFTVTYNGTVCEFTILVTAPAGGSSAFTVACTGATPAGTYVVGTALSASNTITLNVTVTAIGSWSVTTAPAVNGIIFSGTGTFATTGATTITLSASGTPAAAGTFTFTVTGGTGTCTFQCIVTAVANPDYFPRTAFSNWSYEFDGNVDPSDTLLYYAISPTKTINGNTYNVFFYNDGIDVDSFGYYRRSGGDYFEWIDMGSYVGLDNPVWMEWTFLKDNLTTNATWNSAQFNGLFNGVPVTLRWEFTITGQNIPFTVNSSAGAIPYTNVIRVKQELKQLVGTSWVLAAWFDSYFARDKGLIKQDLYDDANALIYEQDVRRLVIY